MSKNKQAQALARKRWNKSLMSRAETVKTLKPLTVQEVIDKYSVTRTQAYNLKAGRCRLRKVEEVKE